jgi:hypothetical protein
MCSDPEARASCLPMTEDDIVLATARLRLVPATSTLITAELEQRDQACTVKRQSRQGLRSARTVIPTNAKQVCDRVESSVGADPPSCRK